MKYVHTNIISTNWKKLSAFYIEVFNCQVVPPIRNQSGHWLSQGTGVPNAKLEGVHLLLPGHGENGPTLEIYQYEKVEPLDDIQPNTRGFGHLAFEVENVVEIVAQIEARGGTKNGEITTRIIEGVGEITFIYVRDPEGNLIEIQHWAR